MRAALIILLAAACASSYEPGHEGTAEVWVFTPWRIWGLSP
jgi:hypothetical protein